MTTRAEEIAGPYMVKKLGSPEGEYWYTVVGADGRRVMSLAMHEPRADLMAYALNAAYKQGRQDRWIPVSEERQPERNTMAIYWTPGLDGTIESGYPAIADEWRWEHHGQYATHYLDFSTPNPEQR